MQKVPLALPSKIFVKKVVVRDKGSKQFLYEIKFIEKEKSSQQSMTDESASPAPLGDAENKPILTHSEKKSNTPDENSSKKPPKNRFALTENAETKEIHGYTLNKDADVNEDLLEELRIYDPSAEVSAEGKGEVPSPRAWMPPPL